MTREELMDMAMNALAVPSGAVDETLFGLPSKYIPQMQEMKEKYPTATMAGQVGSYFIPGTGVVGGAGKIAKMLGMVKKAKAVGQDTKPLIKAILGAAKSGGLGAVESGGQATIRKTLGTADENIEDAALTGGASGLALGAISPGLSAAAKKIYFDPRIVNKKHPKSIAAGEELLNRGVIGGEATFRKYAGEAGNEYNKILGKYQQGISKDTMPVEYVLGKFANRAEDKVATGNTTSARQFKLTGEGATSRLGESPTGEEILKYRKLMTDELSALDPQKRALAIAGAGDGGRVSAKDEAFGSMKGSLDDAEKYLIERRFGQEGADAVGRAKGEYGLRRELGRSLDKGKEPGIMAPSAMGVAGYGASALMGSPAPLAIGLGVAGGSAAAKSLPGRTSIGVLLDRIAKTSGEKAGRLSELSMREQPQGQSKMPNELEQILNKKTSGLPEELQNILESK